MRFTFSDIFHFTQIQTQLRKKYICFPEINPFYRTLYSSALPSSFGCVKFLSTNR